MLSIDVVTTVAEFEALREPWNALAESGGCTVFQTWEWSWHWWRANGGRKRLWLLVARNGDGIAAIAPLCISASHLGFPIRVASFIGTGGTDYLNVIGDSIAARSLLDYALSHGRWDALDLHQIPEGSALAGLAGEAAASHRCACSRLVQDTAFKLELPASWDEYLALLSKKFRWNVQYYGRLLARDFNVSIRLSEPATVADDMAAFFKLHQKRFISKKKPGAYLNPKFRSFHTALAADMCRRGWLRLYIMELNGTAAAALYGFRFADSFYYYLGGFEPELGAMSVSTVLIGKAIEDAIGEGASTFDFLRGNEPYKLKWLARESPNQRIIVTRPGKKAEMAQKMLALENELAIKAKDAVQNK